MATTVQHTDQTVNARGPFLNVLLTTGATWTDQPAALTEFNGATSGRVRVDTTPFNKARLSANVGSVAGATTDILQVQVSTDDGSTWTYLDGLLTTNGGPQAPIGATNSGTAKTNAGPWVSLAAAAKSSQALIRLVGLGGDATIDPVLGTVQVTFAA